MNLQIIQDRTIQMNVLTVVLTLPTIVWIYLRFAIITNQRYSKIRHHIQSQGLRIYLHLISGVFVLILVPYLAYLTRPRKLHDKDSISSDIFFLCVGLALAILHLTTICLLPHPKRFREYYCKDQKKKLTLEQSSRKFIKVLTWFHASNIQFMAMDLSAIAIIINKKSTLIAITILVASFSLYLTSIFVSILEIKNIPWESNNSVQRHFFPIFPFGVKSKSNLTERAMNNSSKIFQTSFPFFMIIGTIAAIQTACQIHQLVLEGSSMPSRSVQEFFVTLLIYMTTVMDAGFFALSQSPSEVSLSWIDLGDVILTQFWPILLNVLGAEWLRLELEDNTIDMGIFMKQQIFWTS